MKLAFLVLTLFNLISVSFGSDKKEEVLKSMCSDKDFASCENLAAYYIKTANWNNANLLGEELCRKERYIGCTLAGTALMAKGKTKEGIAFWSRACDAFEPYACRSLGRLMKNNREELLRYIFMKRSCLYGLHEVCTEVKKPKAVYSSGGMKFLKELNEDCSDTQSSACQAQLKKAESCADPLTKNDCLLLPGELSIFFRAKLLQSEAKLSLMGLVASEKTHKETSPSKRYSYDLSEVLKGFKPQDKYRYVFGFMNACGKKYETKKNLIDDSLNLYPEAYKDLSSRVISNMSAFFSKDRPKDCLDPVLGFEAFAVANLDPLNPSRLDIWKVNSDGDLVHIKDGLPLY